MVVAYNTTTGCSTRVTSTYPVTVTETGLPKGTTWGVGVETGILFFKTATAPANISFHEPNGSYALHALTIAGGTGCVGFTVNVTVNGSALAVTVPFAYNATSGCSTLGTPPVVGAPGTNWGEIGLAVVGVAVVVGVVYAWKGETESKSTKKGSMPEIPKGGARRR